MARMSWGGAADYSQYFLQLYDAYSSRLESDAQAAIRDAAEEQAALDEDKFNQWQAGEITDAEWLAYVKQRLSETTDDEEQQTYWKDLLRNSEQQIASDRIEKGVEEIQEKIESGQATYDDLRKYLMREQARLGKDSPLYEQLGDSIDDIEGVIRDNAANGEIARAQYLLQSGQISGSQAAAMVRAAAERYKNSDPARYWGLLSSAYEMQTFGAGGSGGGGGGGGGGGPSLSNTIDVLEYQADAIDLLEQQYKDGESVGTLPDGTPVVLRDETGAPSPEWESIDDMMIDTLRAQYEAKVANGDRDAVEALQRLNAYITDSIQPRNTVPAERQFGEMQRSLAEAVLLADRDPAAGARAIEQEVARMERWASRLNTNTTTEFVGETPSDEQARENPELMAAHRRSVTTEADATDSTTGEFAAMVTGTVAGYRSALAGEVGPDADRLTQSLGTVGMVSNGLADGSWTHVMGPDGEMTAVPVRMVTVDPPGDAPPFQERRPDLSANPDLAFNEGSQEMVPVLTRIDGKTVAVWGVGTYVMQGEGESAQRVLMLSDGERSYMRGAEGGWMDANGNDMAMPVFGMTRQQAQGWVNQNPDVAASVLRGAGVDEAGMATAFAPQRPADRPAAGRPGIRRGGERPVEDYRGGRVLNYEDSLDPGRNRLSLEGNIAERAKSLGINLQVQKSGSLNYAGPGRPRVGGAPKPPQLSFDPAQLRRSMDHLKASLVRIQPLGKNNSVLAGASTYSPGKAVVI